MRNSTFLGRGALILALPLLAAACSQNQPKSELTAAMSPGEQACAAQAARATGLDASTVQVVQTTKTTEGNLVYLATAGAHSFMCETDTNNQVKTFENKS